MAAILAITLYVSLKMFPCVCVWVYIQGYRKIRLENFTQNGIREDGAPPPISRPLKQLLANPLQNRVLNI